VKMMSLDESVRVTGKFRSEWTGIDEALHTEGN